MSQRKHDKFIFEMKDLIKSLMTFCKPKVSILNNDYSEVNLIACLTK